MTEVEVNDTLPSSTNIKQHWEAYLDGRRMDCVRVTEPETGFVIVSFTEESVERQMILARVTDW